MATTFGVTHAPGPLKTASQMKSRLSPLPLKDGLAAGRASAEKNTVDGGPSDFKNKRRSSGLLSAVAKGK